jgi:hypothetical protein
MRVGDGQETGVGDEDVLDTTGFAKKEGKSR